MESGFEQRFASRESTLASRDGFQGFLLLRRDGAPDDGFTHSTLSVWRDKARRWGRAEREGVWGGWKSVAGGSRRLLQTGGLRSVEGIRGPRGEAKAGRRRRGGRSGRRGRAAQGAAADVREAARAVVLRGHSRA